MLEQAELDWVRRRARRERSLFEPDRRERPLFELEY
jgi:hypothetical protein